jgi:hypothetical protein
MQWLRADIRVTIGVFPHASGGLSLGKTCDLIEGI